MADIALSGEGGPVTAQESPTKSIVAGKASPKEKQISRKLDENMSETKVYRWKQAWAFFLTFLAYVCYYISRKPLSVAKSEIIQCQNDTMPCSSFINEIDGKSESDAKRTSSLLDTTFLFSYAFFLFVCGVIAERSDLRTFLTVGLLLTGFSSALFGIGKLAGVQSIVYYILVQVLSGGVQATGWPATICVMTNWFGKSKRGLVFGFWNANVSVGNILGSILAGAFVERDWALSFVVPGVVTMAFGLAVWLLILPTPANEPLVCYWKRKSLPDMESAADLSIEAETFLTKNKEAKTVDGVAASEAMSMDTSGEKPISFLGALKIPGVIEFSFCLFFVKLVCITFHFWLPYFIKETGVNVSPATAAYLSTLFDLGGIIGGICAGQISDYTGKSALTCAVMLFLAVPSLFLYHFAGDTCPLDWGQSSSSCFYLNASSLVLLGILVNGPYALISTAVSVNLGTHHSLRGSSRALATVTAIIDGTGGAGAAIGPFLAGAIPGGVQNVFYMLMASDLLALILLARPIVGELSSASAVDSVCSGPAAAAAGESPGEGKEVKA